MQLVVAVIPVLYVSSGIVDEAGTIAGWNEGKLKECYRLCARNRECAPLTHLIKVYVKPL
jgi:hypothetical protein